MEEQRRKSRTRARHNRYAIPVVNRGVDKEWRHAIGDEGCACRDPAKTAAAAAWSYGLNHHKWQGNAAAAQRMRSSPHNGMPVLRSAVQNRLHSRNVREHDSKSPSVVRRSSPGAGRKVGEMASSAFSASQLAPRTWIIFVLHRPLRLPSHHHCLRSLHSLGQLAISLRAVIHYHHLVIPAFSISTQLQSPTSAHTDLISFIPQ